MIRAIVWLIVVLAVPVICGAATILETATRGPSGNIAGVSLVASTDIGARFHLDHETLIDHIGGEFFQDGDPSALTFGAITALSPSGFPVGGPSTFQPLAETTFVAVQGQDLDLMIPLSVTLPPGDYALIFGGNRFGATTSNDNGPSSMPFNNVPTSQASFFTTNPVIYASEAVQDENPPWSNATNPNAAFRFLITGTPVPEPSTVILAALGGLALLANRRRR
jgi:hypothetical protein